MNTIENEKVKLICLDLSEWEMLLKKPEELEKKYNLSQSRNQEEKIIQEIMVDLLDKIKRGLMHYKSHTTCAIVYKLENRIVGTISLKGKMNKKEFSDYHEIGYGINNNYWNLGIVTNAINLFLKTMKENQNITKFIAETDVENIGSQSVLRKNNFRKIQTKGNSLFFIVEK
jgi:RimJ/RimL family protein N-acetyltransferase